MSYLCNIRCCPIFPVIYSLIEMESRMKLCIFKCRSALYIFCRSVFCILQNKYECMTFLYWFSVTFFLCLFMSQGIITFTNHMINVYILLEGRLNIYSCRPAVSAPHSSLVVDCQAVDLLCGKCRMNSHN